MARTAKDALRLTYAKSGVNSRARARSLTPLLAAVTYRPPRSHGRALGPSGHYAGLIRIGRETIAITTDTVGTKVLLAEQLGRYEEIGEDAVAINVNDLAAVGARAAGLVDVINCARPEPKTFAALGRGINRGLAAAQCALLGGETAVVPSLLKAIDVGGTAIGFFPDGRRPITGDRIRTGDRILGIPSAGFHANGYTLLRALIRRKGLDLRRPRPGARLPLGVELLRPTRTYCRATEAVADSPHVRGFAHITGGGVRNLLRLNARVAYVLDRWPDLAGAFAWVRELGEIEDRELFQTFNMGIGFAVVVARSGVGPTLRSLARAGFGDAVEIGRIAPGKGVQLPSWGLSYSEYS